MATVKSPVIERPKKSGRNGEIIRDLDDNMAEYSIAPQVYGVQTNQEPVIPNPLVPRPAIGTINHPMTIHRSDETVEHVLPTQQFIHITGADGSSRYVSECGTDIYGRLNSKFKTIIEMFPSGTICKIYLPDIDPYWAIINKIEFSTTHLEPALYIEFFKIEDILAMPDETSPDTLSQYPGIQMCTIYIPEQIESIDSSDAAEMSRELIKNEMNAIKKQIAALKDNLRRLSRLKNSGDSTSRLFSEIDRKYYALIRSFEQKKFMKRP